MTETTQATQPVWPVKHSPLLRAPERFISREGIQGLVRRLTDNLVSITDETGEFLLRLDDGRVIDTKGWAGWEWTHGIGLYGIWQYYDQTGDTAMRDVVDLVVPELQRRGRYPRGYTDGTDTDPSPRPTTSPPERDPARTTAAAVRVVPTSIPNR